MKLHSYYLSMFLCFFAFTSMSQMDTLSVRVYCQPVCKSMLEEIAKTYEGIETATYQLDKGRMLVHYKGEINKDQFVFHFVSKGYDAEHVRAKDVLYDLLPVDCKYVRKPEDVRRD